MSVRTLQPTAENRTLIVNTILAGGTQVTWVLNGGSGFIWNGSSISCFGSNIATLASSGYLVLGNIGIAATQGILNSAMNKMLADDYVTAQLLASFQPA